MSLMQCRKCHCASSLSSSCLSLAAAVLILLIQLIFPDFIHHYLHRQTQIVAFVGQLQ